MARIHWHAGRFGCHCSSDRCPSTRRLREGSRLTLRTSHNTINGGRVGRRSFIPRYELLRESGVRRRPYRPRCSTPDAREGTRMDIRFWGTRGSLAKPGRITLRHGGNTSCVEVRGDDGSLIVLDCGTGAHRSGQALLSAGPRCDGHLTISHTHWDHIQGFPFFAPLFVPGNTWDIYAPGALGLQLEQLLAGQMEYNYFPVTLAQLAATIRFHDIAEGEFAIGEMRVPTQYSNPPALTLGYRLQSGSNSVVYSVDHEPHAPNPAARAEGEPPRHKEDQRHIDFLADADLVIHDSQYTIAEYPQKTGWGH